MQLFDFLLNLSGLGLVIMNIAYLSTCADAWLEATHSSTGWVAVFCLPLQTFISEAVFVVSCAWFLSEPDGLDGHMPPHCVRSCMFNCITWVLNPSGALAFNCFEPVFASLMS